MSESRRREGAQSSWSLHLLTPVSIASFIYLYCYPFFHNNCHFPLPSSTSSPSAAISGDNGGGGTPAAPFRLLIYADPQIPGRSSISGLDFFRRRFAYHARRLRQARDNSWHNLLVGTTPAVLWDVLSNDARLACYVLFKRLDFWGNDYYLRHVYRTLNRWTTPTHQTVLGDLVSFQGMGDEEFEARAGRYWNRIFGGMTRVDDVVTATGKHAPTEEDKKRRIERVKVDDSLTSPWATRLINVVGNHDIGYAGDISASRIARFEQLYGRTNYDIFFEYPAYNDTSAAASRTNDNDQVSTPPRAPSIHVINLNNLLLDGPALSPESQEHVYQYADTMLSQRSKSAADPSTFTLLLTHVPLHKRAGICVDSPMFTVFDDYARRKEFFKPGGISEQNFLSPEASYNTILQRIFGMSDSGRGRNGLILNGHDHHGCDSVHFLNYTSSSSSSDSDISPSWAAERYNTTFAASLRAPSIREVTMPSMMGSYGGNAGLLSVWFDPDPTVREWKYDLNVCRLGTQHVWWAVHILGLVVLAVCSVSLYKTTTRRCFGRRDGKTRVR